MAQPPRTRSSKLRRQRFVKDSCIVRVSRQKFDKLLTNYPIFMGEGYYRIGQAAKILGISSYHLRRLCELGLVAAEYSGHQWQILVSMVENLLRTGVPPIPAGEIGPREPNGSHSDKRLLAAPSDHAITSAEERLASEHRVEITRNRAEQIKAEREIETQLDWFRQRSAKQEAERERDRKVAELRENAVEVSLAPRFLKHPALLPFNLPHSKTAEG